MFAEYNFDIEMAKETNNCLVDFLSSESMGASHVSEFSDAIDIMTACFDKWVEIHNSQINILENMEKAKEKLNSIEKKIERIC